MNTNQIFDLLRCLRDLKKEVARHPYDTKLRQVWERFEDALIVVLGGQRATINGIRHILKDKK